MINFTVYSADCVGNSGNCLYPNKHIVSDKETFIAATKMDHVTAKYKGNYRSKDNFEYSDCIPLDCDNDNSDNPNEWVTPLDIALEIPGVLLLYRIADTTTFQRELSLLDQGFISSSLLRLYRMNRSMQI